MSREHTRAYSKELMRELREEGLSGVLASRVVSAVAKAMDAEESLLAVLDEVKKAGKPDVAGMVWSEHIASLLACIPRKLRKRFVEVVLKLADAMDEAGDNVS